MIAVDSSVAIAAFSTWHEHHKPALEVLDEEPRLVGHAAVETYSVLTRLPPPHRAGCGVVQEFLRANFSADFLVPSAADLETFLAMARKHEITGGAIYDGLIAYTAKRHEAELVSADSRAAQVYDVIGVRRRALA